MRLFRLGNNSDRSWQWYGENDPYYGVLSGDEYRRENLSRENLASFFDSGVAHVERVMTAVSGHLGLTQTESCLDFGCGVGRLVIPFARKFDRVVGIDVSDAMIVEARKNCVEAGALNVDFYNEIPLGPAQFDLIHSYIVIQHIPVTRGMAIVDQLIDRMAPTGAAFIHLTIGRNAGWLRSAATAVRKNVPMAHWLLNVFNGRKTADAYMQMNSYPLNALLARLHDRGIRRLWCELENHQGSYGVCLAFRR